jgi:hypothetical protein
MAENLMVVFEFMIILLLILDCCILFSFAREHTILLDIIKHNLNEIRKSLREK